MKNATDSDASLALWRWVEDNSTARPRVIVTEALGCTRFQLPDEPPAPDSYAVPSLRRAPARGEQIDLFAINRPLWRTPESWIHDLLAFVVGEPKLAAFKNRTNRPIDNEELGGLAARVRAFAAELDEWLGREAVRLSVPYLWFCHELTTAAPPVAILGKAVTTGKVLALVLAREGTRVLAYRDRARVAAGALMEALQVYALASGVPMPPESGVGRTDWYVARISDVGGGDADTRMRALVIDEPSANGTLATPPPKRPRDGDATFDPLNWLEEFVSTLAKEAGVTTTPPDFDEELQKMLDRSVASQALKKNDLDRLLDECPIAIDVLKKFDPVLFLSLCHPTRVLGEHAVTYNPFSTISPFPPPPPLSPIDAPQPADSKAVFYDTIVTPGLNTMFGNKHPTYEFLSEPTHPVVIAPS